MTNDEITAWLQQQDKHELDRLFAQADLVRKQGVGDQVHLRGLIEFGNRCIRACTYCGIRSANKRLARYRMTKKEIMDCAALAHSLGYGTVVLQSGEDDRMSAEWLGEIIREIKEAYPLAVAISVGERPIKDYILWRKKGADRYLLKFETSDTKLFRKIHPPHKNNNTPRIAVLLALRKMGYEIGSGIMVGLPGQTYDSVRQDIRLFAKLDLDMIAIGPYIPHPNTPLGYQYLQDCAAEQQVPNTDLMTYKIIALTRINCPQANIPATSALASVDPGGFQGGLKAGANVIMPNITPIVYRALYQIYPHTFFQSPADLHQQIIRTIEKTGRITAKGPGNRIRPENRTGLLQKPLFDN